ncbi:MAG: Gldg family protein [Leptolyngbyaceae cyanobacterium bins.59]|nr:Gldg family protein [Leptolyngbyaceae cyanobacterium bins.59]
MKKIQKYWQILFWVGPLLIIVGLTAGVVAGNWVPIPTAILFVGVVISLLGLLLQASASGFWGQRSTQASTNAIVATVAVLVILSLINFLGSRYTHRIDLTESQLFTLAPQSQEVLRRLQQPVRAIVFQPQRDLAAQAILEQYQRQSPQFSFEFLNPEAQPQLAKAFGVQDFGDVFLDAGQRRQFVQSIKFEPLSEGKLTSGLEKITGDRQLKLYFLQGHGERPLEASAASLSQAVAALGERNFAVEPLTLAQQPAVPKDAAVIVIAGPQQPLLEGEIKALQAYLDQGGSLLVMLDPTIDAGLTELLKQWGVVLENTLAINASEQQVSGLGPAASVISQYGEHPITRAFTNRFSIYPAARPIGLVPVTGITQTPLLITGPQTWAETDLKSGTLSLDEAKGDRPGPLTLGVALSKPIGPAKPASPSPSPAPSPPPDPTKPEARLVVFGNSAFATNSLFGQTQQVNGDVLLNSISWLSKQNDPVLSIRPKDIKNRRFTLVDQQRNVLALVAMGLFPAIGFGAAGYAWWRRR